MDPYLTAFGLFFGLLNPFLMSIYLLDLILALPARRFLAVMTRGALIAGAVFIVFAWAGEAVFTALHVRFASFQIFGGVVFVIIGIRFMFQGAETLRSIRGNAEHLEGSVAMPFMIGPGTVSASVVIGHALPAAGAAAVILGTLALTVLLVFLLKLLHDAVKERSARLTDRYVEIVGRISALLIGTIAIDMILTGVGTWLREGGTAAQLLGR